MLRSTYFFLFLVFLGLGPFTQAYATPKNGELILFMPDTNWPPYITSQEPDKPRGVLVEIISEAVKPLGYTLIIKALPDRRGWIQLDAGDVDAHAKAREWVKEPEKYLWTIPFLKSVDTLLTTADSDLEYSTPEDLKGLRVAVINSFYYPTLERYFDNGSITRIDASDPYRMIEMVDRGRADAAVVNRRETQWLFKTRPDLSPERFTIHKTPIDSAWYRFAFTRANGWEPHLPRINQKLEAMLKDGRMESILCKYQ